MRVLALDPGAKRMGWACLGDAGTDNPAKYPKYYGSGVIGLTRGASEAYQTYRLRLIWHIAQEIDALMMLHQPSHFVSETLPVKGYNNMSQPFLAMTAITVAQTIISTTFGMALNQIAAPTVKVRIGGDKKASKVKVRNGVLHLLPELQPKKSRWVKEFDEPDAIAVGLTFLGYDLRTPVV